MKPRAMIIHASGTNRDHDVAWALELAGAKPEIVHINALRDGNHSLLDYQMMVLPGGFSYGDDLGAGKLWAVALRNRLGEELDSFIGRGRPVLGICNGFQALIKSGLLPSLDGARDQQATLTHNKSGKFECRWVDLIPEGDSFWTENIEPIQCPVAHGEGRFFAGDATLEAIERQGMVAVRYRTADYPDNPNGSANRIAGIVNPAGNVLGMMPHPENHIVPAQHPDRHRSADAGSGLPLFRNGVAHAART